jgi:hypothetical protein
MDDPYLRKLLGPQPKFVNSSHLLGKDSSWQNRQSFEAHRGCNAAKGIQYRRFIRLACLEHWESSRHRSSELLNQAPPPEWWGFLLAASKNWGLDRQQLLAAHCQGNAI